MSPDPQKEPLPEYEPPSPWINDHEAGHPDAFKEDEEHMKKFAPLKLPKVDNPERN